MRRIEQNEKRTFLLHMPGLVTQRVMYMVLAIVIAIIRESSAIKSQFTENQGSQGL